VDVFRNLAAILDSLDLTTRFKPSASHKLINKSGGKLIEDLIAG
jgi:hypothetical protein